MIHAVNVAGDVVCVCVRAANQRPGFGIATGTELGRPQHGNLISLPPHMRI